MNADPVLKCLKSVISELKSAQYFNQHDMVDSVAEKIGRAIGSLESTILFVELETGKPITEGKQEPVQ